MNPFGDLFSSHPFLILDGAMATELERKGANLNDPLWSAKILLEKPALIQETHLDYLQAGADIITTSTYQATFEGLQRNGLSKKQARDIFTLAARLAENARDEFYQNENDKREILIAGSVGPYGAYLADGSEYRGIYQITKKALKEFHRERLEFLIKTNIDLLIFETIPNLTETEVLVELLQEMQPTTPALFSFSCKDPVKLADGNKLKEATIIASESNSIKAIGVNCINPKLVTPILTTISKNTDLPLLAYPNNGNGWDPENKCWIENHLANASETQWSEWLGLGAKIIGGCCQSTPNTIYNLLKFRQSHFLQTE